MKIKLIGFILVLAVVGLCNVREVSGQKDVLSSFCKFPLTEQQMQANLTFTQGYTFKIDKAGKASVVKRILGRDAWVTDDKAIACFEQWRFTGFEEGQRFTVYFAWVHAEGWTRMTIRTKNFSQVVIDGEEIEQEDQQL